MKFSPTAVNTKLSQVKTIAGAAAEMVFPTSSSAVLTGVASSGSRLRVSFSPMMLYAAT